MKTINTCFIGFLLLFAFSFQSFCQSNQIISDSKPYKYLIGKAYSEVSELGDFVQNSRSSITNAKGEKQSSANLIKGDLQIITSEITWFDKNKKKEVHKILDVIVLKGKYTTCGGCLLSKKKGNTIKSIYPYGTNDDDAILLAFERNRKTGKYKQVNPNKLERNPRYLAHKK